jgi:hypothetical protein
MLLLEKLKRDLRFTMYEIFEEFNGSKFNCLRRSKVQGLAALSSLRSVEEFEEFEWFEEFRGKEKFEGFRTWILEFESWVLDFGFWNLEFGSWILVFLSLPDS